MLHYSYTTWGCADSFGMLCTFKIMLHYSYTTWGCADYFGVFQAVCRKGSGAGWCPFTGLDPFWVPGTTKRSCVQTETWCAGETLAMSLTWGCRWLVRLGVLFFAFNIYTYVIFSFIEIGESKFIRVQWKRLFQCAAHVRLLSVIESPFSECLLTKHLENTQSKHSGVAFIMNCSVGISSFYKTQTASPM
jgi:hypothetical protein